MTTPLEDFGPEDVAALREEAEALSKESVVNLYLRWRGYANQWQEWADSKIDGLGLTDPEVMLGRTGSQAALSMVLAMVDVRELPTLAAIQAAVDTFETERNR